MAAEVPGAWIGTKKGRIGEGSMKGNTVVMDAGMSCAERLEIPEGVTIGVGPAVAEAMISLARGKVAEIAEGVAIAVGITSARNASAKTGRVSEESEMIAVGPPKQARAADAATVASILCARLAANAHWRSAKADKRLVSGQATGRPR
mmetsp:Transcript_90645/g.255951  ORF Transcript_90645/g.255951 Transcript_90645/m.255951 type:complete len:148 (+) Transcript_90645:930-1373(+)